MAKKEKTSLVTYPILEDVRDALKAAAFETNSCFWDMYLNMGGENSIQRWSEEKPACEEFPVERRQNLNAAPFCV